MDVLWRKLSLPKVWCLVLRGGVRKLVREECRLQEVVMEVINAWMSVSAAGKERNVQRWAMFPLL